MGGLIYKILIFFIFIIAFIGCKNSIKEVIDIDNKKEFKPIRIHDHDSMRIPVDLKIFSRKSKDVYWISNDTITKNKNFIKYLKSNDSCCRDNIYINWGNDTVNRIFIAQNVLNYRVYFTPRFIAETKDYLILEHGCATDCWAVLFLPLNNFENPQDVLDIIKYDKNNFTVVKGLDDYFKETEHEFIEAYNVKTKKTKRIKFKNSGISAVRRQLIDSCKITDKFIYIKAELFDRGKDNDVIEVLRLDNDIK